MMSAELLHLAGNEEKRQDADVKYIHSECFGTRRATFANRYCPGKLPRESRMED